MEIINLTPHEIRVILGSEKITFPASGQIALVEEKRKPLGFVVAEKEIPLNRISYGEIEGLPDFTEGTIYLVSRVVLAAAKGRKDLVAPGNMIRKDDGTIAGCDGFITY